MAYIDHMLAIGLLPADPRTATEDNVQPTQSDHRNQYRREKKPENDLNRLCRHRGEQTGTTHCKPCQSRTGKREDVAVFACSVHGECTLYQTGKAKLPGCNKCHDFEAVDGE